MFISLTERRTITATLPDRTISDMEIDSEWNGLTKLVHPASGLYLIVMREEGLIVDGSKSLIDDLLAPTVEELFIRVPERTLPNGVVVPSFLVAQYACCVDAAGKAYVSATEKPRNNINYHAATKAAVAAGWQLERGTQALSIALDIASQDINWTGGKVGEGNIFMGIHKGNVNGPQPGTYESSDSEERRWHQLSTGERIYDYAGNLFTWLFDDIHGNDEGIVHEAFGAESPYLKFPPYPVCEKGTGWRPSASANWSGRALVRGGCWRSGSDAGVFRLGSVDPRYDYGDFGFRCTKPVGL